MAVGAKKIPPMPDLSALKALMMADTGAGMSSVVQVGRENKSQARHWKLSRSTWVLFVRPKGAIIIFALEGLLQE